MVSANKVTQFALVYNTSAYLYRFRKELIEALCRAGHGVLAVVPDREAAPQIEALGATCVGYRLSARGLNPVFDMMSCYELVQIFRQHKPRVVLNFTIKPVIYGSIAARAAGVERIYSMIPGLGRVFNDTGALRRLLKSSVSLAYRAALLTNERVFFQNPEDRILFIEQGMVRRDRAVRINGSGVNLTDFQPGPTDVKKDSFLLTSRIFEEKGVRQFVAAARHLKRAYPQAVFNILGPIQPGGGIEDREMSAWVREGIVNYLGEVADVRPYLAECGVFVLPTYYREGIPRSIIEAMAMGKPIITTAWPGCRETVSEGENGFLVPVKDADALACAMQRFLDTPDEVDRMGRASRVIAARKFDVHAVNKLVLAELTSGITR